MMSDNQIFGDRWDENEPALKFEDKFKQASVSKQIEVLDQVLNDHHNRFGNEIARAAGMLLLNKVRNPSSRLLEAAITTHRYILHDQEWLAKFPEAHNASRLIREELEQLIRKHASLSNMAVVGNDALSLIEAKLTRTKRVSASSIVFTKGEDDADVVVSQFSKFVSDAILSLSESDDQLQKTAKAVDDALDSAESRRELSVDQITAVYLPFVQVAFERLYEIVGSGQHKISEIFPARGCHDVAREMAVEWRHNH